MEMRFRSLGFALEVTAVSGELLVGMLTWDTDTQIVDIVWTHPEYRRQGIATAMWQHAQTLDVPAPKHSRDQTRDGKAWIATLTSRGKGK